MAQVSRFFSYYAHIWWSLLLAYILWCLMAAVKCLLCDCSQLFCKLHNWPRQRWRQISGSSAVFYFAMQSECSGWLFWACYNPYSALVFSLLEMMVLLASRGWHLCFHLGKAEKKIGASTIVHYVASDFVCAEQTLIFSLYNREGCPMLAFMGLIWNYYLHI